MAQMRYRRLGTSGLVVSVVGLGCNNLGRKLDLDGTRAVVDAAIEHGITLFDTADIYGDPHGASEELLGAALKGRRDEVVLATKFGMDMAGANGPDRGALGARRYVRRAVEASLRRLGTDYVDLYQMHAPDPGTPIEETLSTLDSLVREGQARYQAGRRPVPRAAGARAVGHRGRADRVRRQARGEPARGRDRWPGREAGRGERHRRRDGPGAGRRERGGRTVGADRRGPRRAGR